MLESTARSADGGTILVSTVGSGPGVVVLHGGGIAARDYHRLAAALAERCTVHLYDRRGRPGSPPLDGTETVATDVADLAAVLEHTGARQVFGHSGGGFVALRAGLALPLERIAVYDPGLSVDGRPSFAFLEAFEEAVSRGQHARAMTVMARAVHPQDPGAKLPYAAAELLTRAFLRTPIGRRFVELLPTVPPEVRRIAEHDGPASDYTGITAEVLLAAGSRSSTYFAENCAALAAAIPGGRAVVLPGCSHNAANIARPSFVRPFADFLGAPVSATAG
ncbi:Pimeloyl-ACP methyl ester carboxylesterase [Friedmanniella luteola]|uniref:Pimeloyl-ACP methyl ester carboxylesterase n=1 Tax=Friedmanniella luteola TaxID=546871 RepID=A0A1H1MVV5_9ACTN|nr:alpha/beta hydrolase [Friedmanniella luteola]SDR90595.1 Pimeloyl-ACP methyl ester carboxylesterase [Friedmanniella luteola]